MGLSLVYQVADTAFILALLIWVLAVLALKVRNRQQLDRQTPRPLFEGTWIRQTWDLLTPLNFPIIAPPFERVVYIGFFYMGMRRTFHAIMVGGSTPFYVLGRQVNFPAIEWLVVPFWQLVIALVFLYALQLLLPRLKYEDVQTRRLSITYAAMLYGFIAVFFFVLFVPQWYF